MPALTKTRVLWSLVSLLLPAVAQAQMVEVERGYVRAPFVRVYRTPDGGTRVRAPFVDVRSDGSRRTRSQRGRSDLPASPLVDGHAPVVPNATGVPMQIDVTELDWRSLKAIVRSGEAELEERLNQYRAADRWKTRLYVGSLRQLLTAESNQPPEGETRERLQKVLDAYDYASIKPAFRPVTGLSEFQSVHRALRELLLSPLERQRARLATAARGLDETLARMSNGAVWADYLRLPESLFAPDDNVAGGQADEWSGVLDRFESVSVDRRYRVIAVLPSFQATHRHLADYIALLHQRPLPPVEVLPTPSGGEVPSPSLD